VHSAVHRYGPDPQQHVAFWPAGARGTLALVHGGYWRARHTAELMLPLVDPLRALGWTVANVEYRRVGTGGGWPATVEDAGDAIDLVRREATGPVVIVGHSVGGQLALLHAARADAVVALAPVTDLVRGFAEGIGEDAVIEFMGVTPDEDPAAYAAASPIVSTPPCPVLVVHGADDARVPVAHTRDYVATARAAGADITLHEPPELSHLAIIDPDAAHWAGVHEWLSGRGADGGRPGGRGPKE
jgi:acetyl esterase/lipase